MIPRIGPTELIIILGIACVLIPAGVIGLVLLIVKRKKL